MHLLNYSGSNNVEKRILRDQLLLDLILSFLTFFIHYVINEVLLMIFSSLYN